MWSYIQGSLKTEGCKIEGPLYILHKMLAHRLLATSSKTLMQDQLMQ